MWIFQFSKYAAEVGGLEEEFKFRFEDFIAVLKPEIF
jgi:hypothetical protein